jgi:hypothetical protein
VNIHSKITDYYDHIGNMYGGGDPRVLYIRGEIANCHDRNATTGNICLQAPSIVQLPEVHYNSVKSTYTYAWLIIAGTYHLMCKRNSTHRFHQSSDTMHILCPKLHADIYDLILRSKTYWVSEHTTYEDTIGSFSAHLVSVSKQLKAPVFVICDTNRRTNTIQVLSRIPILSDAGVPAIIGATQMYQELAYYISNVMVESADTSVPVTLADKDMLISKGFHNRISFRHRK